VTAAVAVAVAAPAGLALGLLLDALALRLAAPGHVPAVPAVPGVRAVPDAGGVPAVPAVPAGRWRRPGVAVLTAALLAAVVAVHHASAPDLALGAVLVALLVPAALVDLDRRLIPNALTGPAALAAVALGVALDPGGQVERLAAGALAGGALLAAALARPDGMGLGDVKLAAVLGLLLGAPVAVALLVALACGVLAGAVVVARVGLAAGRRAAIPFGPSLAAGGVAAVLAGRPLLELYLGTA